MREEWENVDGGVRALRVWSEGPQDESLTVVERQILEATLATAVSRFSELAVQIKYARCTCRHFTGYGVYLNFVIPEDTKKTTYAGDEMNGASTNWVESSQADLHAKAFFVDGRLSVLELFPSDGENWSIEDCRRILNSDSSGVMIKTLA